MLESGYQDSHRLPKAEALWLESPRRPSLTRYQRPRLPAITPRQRLWDMLDRAKRSTSATWLAGPAGSGKTSLIAGYVARQELHALWWRLEMSDNDLSSFFKSLRQLAVSHGASSAFGLSADAPSSCELEFFSRDFFRKLFTSLPQPFVLILDDSHRVDLAGPIGDCLSIACDEMPEHGHLYILGRTSPPPGVARLLMKGTLSIVTANDLLVTEDELPAMLVEHGFGEEAQTTHLRLLADFIGGWAAGLALLRHHNLAEKECSPGVTGILASYFRHEVFDALPAWRKDFLMRAALFPVVTEAWIGHGDLDSDSPSKLLRDTLAEHHFIDSCPGELPRFRFHPLFRQFLLAEASARWDAERFQQEAIRAGRTLSSAGELRHALSVFLGCGLPDEAVALLRDAAPCLSRGRQLAEMADLLLSIPVEQVEGRGWFLYWRATANARDDMQESLAGYSRAYARFSEEEDIPGAALAACGAFETILWQSSRMTLLDEWIDLYDKRLRQVMPNLSGDVKIRLFCNVFLALCYRQPGHADLPAYAVQISCWHDSPERNNAPLPLLQHCLTLHSMVLGDHVEAEMALEYMRRGSFARQEYAFWPVAALLRARGLFALHAGHEFSASCMSDGGAGNAKGAPALQTDATLLCVEAAISMNRGDISHAQSLLDEYEQRTVAAVAGRCVLYFVLSAWLKYYLNEHAHALKHVVHAYHAVLDHGAPYFTSVHLLGLGLLSHLCGDSASAVRLLMMGREISAPLNSPFVAFAYNLFSASIEFDLGREDKAKDYLVTSMRVGRRHGYLYFPYFPKPVVARLCLHAMELEIEPAYVRAVIERNHLTADRAWTDAEAWPWPLRIYTLGRFSVVKEGKPINHHGKTQKKPLELLKAIIAFGGRNVSESKLQDALWPEAEGDAASQALATTLFRLRKLIGEGAIHRQNGRLTLDSGICWVDCWALERVSNDGSASRSVRVGRLHRLYQGNFLDDEENAVWATPMRERLKGKFLRLMQ